MLGKIFLQKGLGKALLLLIVCMVSPLYLVAQDQIQKEGSDPLLGKQQTDSIHIDSLLKNSQALRFKNPDSSIILSRQAIELSDDINYEIGKALGFKNIGLIYGDKNNFSDALDFFKRSLIVYEKEKDTLGISSIQN
ncbi:MAG: hypothetical protein P8X60_10580, partial [Robiginitalea sp.]